MQCVHNNFILICTLTFNNALQLLLKARGKSSQNFAMDENLKSMVTYRMCIISGYNYNHACRPRTNYYRWELGDMDNQLDIKHKLINLIFIMSHTHVQKKVITYPLFKYQLQKEQVLNWRQHITYVKRVIF